MMMCGIHCCSDTLGFFVHFLPRGTMAISICIPASLVTECLLASDHLLNPVVFKTAWCSAACVKLCMT